MNYSNHPATKDFRQLQRKYPTSAELLSWKELQNKQVGGYRFRRQHGFGPYIMDFYCPKLRLCIEVDGEIHDTKECIEKDKDRTIFLNQNRITVVRYRNDEVLNHTSWVLESIKAKINEIEKTI